MAMMTMAASSCLIIDGGMIVASKLAVIGPISAGSACHDVHMEEDSAWSDFVHSIFIILDCYLLTLEQSVSIGTAQSSTQQHYRHNPSKPFFFDGMNEELGHSMSNSFSKLSTSSGDTSFSS